MGACFSAGMFDDLPGKNMVAICSAGRNEKQGTWLWHEFLRHTMQIPHSAANTFSQILRRIKTLDASKTYANLDARGEEADAASTQLLGDLALADQMLLGDFFGGRVRIPTQG